MKPVRTLILLASESQMRLLENAGVGKGLSERLSRAASDFDDTATRYADAPGHSQAAPGMAGHGFDRTSSERDQHRAAFARHVIDLTRDEWAKGGHDRLVIAAAPRMLGELRDRLPTPLAGALVADLDKDLTHIDLHDLPGHLDSVLAV
jgi:protein required for attachment to host cells